MRIVLKWTGPVLGAALMAGCATSTIETRKEEFRPEYEALSPEWQQLVDRGQIKVGMPWEAVHIAWGPADQVLESETPQGHVTTWLYHGHWMKQTRYWSYREVRTRDGVFLERYLERDYHPGRYVQAEIHFVDGAVERWRTLPRPL